MPFVRMPPAGCPVCQQKLDALVDSEGEDATPKPGDLSFCLHCTAALEFDEAVLPQPLRAERLAAMTPSERSVFDGASAMVRAFHQHRKSQQSQ
jgi:hypothetical protein